MGNSMFQTPMLKETNEISTILRLFKFSNFKIQSSPLSTGVCLGMFLVKFLKTQLEIRISNIVLIIYDFILV